MVELFTPGNVVIARSEAEPALSKVEGWQTQILIQPVEPINLSRLLRGITVTQRGRVRKLLHRDQLNITEVIMPAIKRFEDIKAWQEARKLVNMVYNAINSSKAFKDDFRLKNQCIGAVISVMGNIPEGFVRRSNKEFIQFLFIAMSSAAEVQSHLYIALDQNYITHKQFNEIYEQAEKTSRMISAFIKYLRKSTKQTKQTKKTK